MKEVICLTRDCFAFMIPSGARIQLHQGTEVVITQALGHSFTVNIFGNLARIDGLDADALGKEVVIAAADLPENATIEDLVWLQLKMVFDPEIPVNIVDLGLVYECDITPLNPDEGEEAYKVNIKMTLTAPGCGMGPVIADDAKRRVQALPKVAEVEVEVVFDPPWSQDMMSDGAKLELGIL